MHSLFDDEDDFLMGSPKSKFMDIVFNANNDIVREELGNLMEKFAVMELMLSKHVGEDIYGEIEKFKSLNLDDVDTKTKSLYIEMMSEILSQSE